MSETLVMLLPDLNAETVHFAIFNEAGGLIQQHYHADMSLIAAQTLTRKVVVVVPSMAVSCLQVTLPKLSARAMRTALPYALEDQLIAEPDALHYTLLQAQPNQANDVLVVDKAVMRDWLLQCEAWQVVPDVFVPSALMLSCEPDTWVVVMKNGVDIRVNDTVGFSCDIDNAGAILKQAMSVYGAPKGLHLYSVTDETLAVGLPVQQTRLSPSAIIDLYVHPNAASLVNLLHGEFQPCKKKVVKQAQLMQTLRVGLGVWLILILMLPMVSWLMLTWHEVGLTHDIKAIARHYSSSGIDSVTASRLLLQEKLKQAASGGDIALFHTLANLGQSMKAVPGIQMERLEFHPPQLSVSVNAQSPSIFSDWMQALLSQGLQAKESNAVIVGGRVHAIVIISKV